MRFDERNFGDYFGERVNALADREGLLWDGRHGSPYEPIELLEKALRPSTHNLLPQRYSRLFDHTLRFKPRGRGRLAPVLAVCSPYLPDNEATRNLAREFAADYGLAYRVGDTRDVVYQAATTVPILFWRPDLHKLVDDH